jgi:hypothetical protein
VISRKSKASLRAVRIPKSFCDAEILVAGQTGSSRNCGRSPGTGSRYASLTSGTMTRITGIVPTAMKTGNSVMMGSCLHGLHQSTTFLFRH